MIAAYGTPDVVIIAAVFLFAGAVKGVVGLGLPTVAIGLLTALIGLADGMVLMVVPAIVTNIWQALGGDALATILRRLWAYLATIFIGAWIGVNIFGRSDAVLLTALLGGLLCLYAVFGLSTPKLPAPGRHERWLTPVLGAINGTLTGLTGTFFMPGVPYFQALGLRRDTMVQAMGVLFLVSTTALAVALAGHGRMNVEIGALSALATLPALLGMAVGARLRRRLSEHRFQQVLFVALLVLGAYIVVRALAG